MDRRTFLLRGSAALAATALAAVLPKQAAAATPVASPIAPEPPTAEPPLDYPWVTLRRGSAVEGVALFNADPPATTLAVDQYMDDAEWSSLTGVHILGGDVKIDRFFMHDYVPQPLYLKPTIAARAKALYGDSFYGHPIVSAEAYTPPTWTPRARVASDDARLQGPARRRLLRGR